MSKTTETKREKPEGSGRVQKYGEPTVTKAYRCPRSRVKEMQAIIKNTLKGWEVK